MSAVLFKPDDCEPAAVSSQVISQSNSLDGNHSHAASPAAVMTLHRSCSTVYEDILGSKINALHISNDGDDAEETDGRPTGVAGNSHQPYCDGSDSGVEVTANVTLSLQRALSSHSGDYASSHGGGLDDHLHNVNLSCNSSMISCNSDVYDIKHAHSLAVAAGSTVHLNGCRSLNNYECYSENGSESSSVAGPTTASLTVRRANNYSNVKKKVAVFEPNHVGSDGSVVVLKGKSSNNKDSVHNKEQQALKSRTGVLKRAVSLTRPSQGTAQQVRERLSDKLHSNDATKACSSSVTSYLNGMHRSQTKPQKPDNLPTQLCRTSSVSMQRLVQRTPSVSRARTPCTPDNGRWSAVSSIRSTSARRGMSVTPDLSSLKMRSSIMNSLDIKSTGSSPYGTLPRRRKQKSVEDLTGRLTHSTSVTTRDSRMTTSVIVTSRKSLASSYNASTASHQKPIATGSGTANRKTQLSATKTRIYHETGCQTALTCTDIEQALCGKVFTTKAVDAVEQRDQETQSEIRDQKLNRLLTEIKHLTDREQELMAKLKREREEKLNIQRELHLNTERVMGLLALTRVPANCKLADATASASDEGECGHDSLLMLESQIQMSGHELIERQQEIGQLRKLCRSLQTEMERSLLQQECLIQEKAAMEKESNELQDFLQHEKAAMCDALKDLENDYQHSKDQLMNREGEVKILKDECRHLVRLNEQRRQENRMLQAKYSALDAKTKDMIAQQNSSVVAATSALTGLYTRLDSLVEQLIFSYNITEQDLEDVGFQSDNQMNGSTNGDLLLDHGMNSSQTTRNYMAAQYHVHSAPNGDGGQGGGSLSPQRNQSFIAAVISAIRNAANAHSGKKLLVRHHQNSRRNISADNLISKTNTNNVKRINSTDGMNNGGGTGGGDESDTTEMLDSETEPCLMMDNVLEDVNMPDSHSHNMISSSTGILSQIDMPNELLLLPANGDDSLHNLSEAIVNRQNVESQVHAMSTQKLNLQLNDTNAAEDVNCCGPDSVTEMPSFVEYSVNPTVLEQVIDVDNLITKLLKVLRYIQIDNDSCIQQLIIDKNKLQQNKEDMLENIKDLQDANVKLQDDLMDATQELVTKTNDLTNTKAEIQRHRNEIDRLTEDVCNLSTLCSNYRKLSPSTELPPFRTSSLHIESEVMDNQRYDDTVGILNLLKMWQTAGHLSDTRIRQFLHNSVTKVNLKQDSRPLEEQLLAIYANQLETTLTVLNACQTLVISTPSLRQLRKDLNIVKANTNWSQLLTNEAQQQQQQQHDADDINAN